MSSIEYPFAFVYRPEGKNPSYQIWMENSTRIIGWSIEELREKTVDIRQELRASLTCVDPESLRGILIEHDIAVSSKLSLEEKDALLAD